MDLSHKYVIDIKNLIKDDIKNMSMSHDAAIREKMQNLLGIVCAGMISNKEISKNEIIKWVNLVGLDIDKLGL